jgi:iron complex transport system substrate-binding protein
VAALVLTGSVTCADAPARVVSLNVCTDQLAMLLAAPGQLVSVSPLARDPRSAAYADAMNSVPTNSGSAEEVVLLKPDLVLAGTFSTQATVSMLTRLGYRVERFAPINSLEDARDNIRRMGDLLGREAQAAQMLAQFDARLTTLSEPANPKPRTALYGALGSTSGRESLPGQILAAAGMENIIDTAEGRSLPLETLILADPDLILVGAPYGGHARATELLSHPALRHTRALRTIDTGANWVCETPALLDAIADMRALREDWQAQQ